MVVEMGSLSDLIAELREESSRIADRIVRWRVNRVAEQAEGVTFQVEVWATALRLGGEDGSDYLLEFGAVVGTDSKRELAGTAAAELLYKKLAEACDDLNLCLRPGKIEVF